MSIPASGPDVPPQDTNQASDPVIDPATGPDSTADQLGQVIDPFTGFDPLAELSGQLSSFSPSRSRSPEQRSALADAARLLVENLGAVPTSLQSCGATDAERNRLITHLGRAAFQGCPTRDFKAAWRKNAEGQDEPGGPVAPDMLPLMLVDAEDPDPIQPGRILVGQVPAGCQGQLVGLVPADAQPTCAGLHAHAVARHALQDPAGDPVGHRLTIVGCLRDRCPEDGDLAVVTGAEQSGHTDVQEAWVSGDGQVRESTFDMVTDSAGVSAARTVQVVLLQSWVENREHSFLRRLASIMAQPA